MKSYVQMWRFPHRAEYERAAQRKMEMGFHGTMRPLTLNVHL